MIMSRRFQTILIATVATGSLFAAATIGSLVGIQRETSSAVHAAIEDIGNDLVASNFSSAERRLELLRRMGHKGLSLEISGDANEMPYLNSCISKSSLPVAIDGQELGIITNCLSLSNFLPIAAQSPLAILIYSAAIFLLLVGLVLRSRFQRLAMISSINNELAELSQQVAHDIRSPLSALTALLDDARGLPEQKRTLLKHSVGRINDIANTLSSRKTQYGSPSESTGVYHLASELDLVISEKRIEYANKLKLRIESDLASGSALFTTFNASDLKRIISNLVNNSVEAFGYSSGTITINLTEDNAYSKITLTDDGPGIPVEIINQLGLVRVTSGKEGTHAGSGRGVFHAKSTVEQFDGEFRIENSPTGGTIATIRIPKASIPSWFQSKLEIPVADRFVVAILDDDKNIHNLWSSRLSQQVATKRDLVIEHFSTVYQFETWLSKNDLSLALIDYEIIGSKASGLDVISRNNLGKKAILVTSRYQDRSIKERAVTLGTRIIPKSLIPTLPIDCVELATNAHASPQLVLLDNDALVRLNWQIRADETGMNLKIYEHPDALFQELGDFDSRTIFYVDNQLSDDISGVDIAFQLHQKGFNELFLETGDTPENLKDYAFIKGVVGKSPTW